MDVFTDHDAIARARISLLSNGAVQNPDGSWLTVATESTGGGAAWTLDDGTLVTLSSQDVDATDLLMARNQKP